MTVFVVFWDSSFNFFFLFVLTNPLLSPGPGSGKTPLSEAQGCRFFVIVQFRSADALLSPEPWGDQGTLFARDVIQGYVRVCVSSFTFCVLCLFYFVFFRPNICPPLRGCRCCHLPSRVFVDSSSNPPLRRWPAGGFLHDFFLVLASVLSSISARARLAIVPFM